MILRRTRSTLAATPFPDTTCVRVTSCAIGKFDECDLLFEDSKPSEATNGILDFCKSFEEAGQRTGLFVEELKKADLLMDGAVSITPGDGGQQPSVYRGFQMVDETTLRDLRGDVLRKMLQSGMPGLPCAHPSPFPLLLAVLSE